MSPERWQQVRSIFDAAAELPGDAAEEYARRACGNDAGLYSEISRMLLEHRREGLLDERHQSPGAPPVFEDGQIVAQRYRIVRYVARGGMGEVYEAEDLDLHETVALKTLLPEVADDEGMVARFKQEIALSRKVAHPNVCRVFDLARHDVPGGRPVIFLTMEFLQGETLAARIRRVPVSTAEALPLLEQMGAALDAAHGAGVIHRDFKPSNVMLAPSADGIRAVVTDFGLARRFIGSGGVTDTISNMIMGTLDYMGPELLAGATATFSSDVYALGMVCYQMVTGALPFKPDTPLAGAIRRSKEAVPSPRKLVPSLDEKWESAILRALAADPGKRFTQARHFLEALRGEAVSMTVRLPVMTRRRIAAAAAGALLLAAGMVGWKAWERERNRLSPEAQVFYRTGVEDIAVGAYFAATGALEDAEKLAPRNAQVHARLAEADVEMDMSEKAKDEMLAAMRLDMSGLSKADRLQIEAIDLSITREFAAAAAKYEEMARALGGGGATAALDLGRAYEKADRPDAAIKSYRQAAEGPEHNPAAWLRLGALYARQSMAAKSAEAFAQAEHLYKLTSNLEGQTELALQEGIAANSRLQLEAGAAYLKKALETAQTAGNVQQQINAWIRLSSNAVLAGDAEAGEGYAREFLDTARSHQFGTLACRGSITIGNVFMRKRQYDRAEQSFREALELARQVNSAHLKAVSLLALASAHDRENRPNEAAREAQDALPFFQANRYTREIGQCLTAILRAQRAKGDYDGAIATLRSQLPVLEKAQDRSQLGLAHETIGSILYKEDRYLEALEEYSKARELATEQEHAGYGSLGSANSLWRLGRYDEAEKMFASVDASAAKFPDLRLEAVYGRAQMRLSQNRYEEAAKMARDAMADKSRNAEITAHLTQVLGLVHIGQGRKAEGLKNCVEAEQTTEQVADVAVVLEGRIGLLQARIEAGDRKQAVSDFQKFETQLANYPEKRWRALAFASQADARYKGPAREALAHLASIWGDQVYQTYLRRPDIRKLSWPLLQANSAVH